MRASAVAFFIALMVAGFCVAQTADQLSFPRESYYGRLSATRADRAFFAKLTRRFQGQPYGSVRRKLIMLGYRPARLRKTPLDQDGYCPYPWRDRAGGG